MKSNSNKFLSLSGLQTLLKALNEKFSKKKHEHKIEDITDLSYASKNKAGIVKISGNYLEVTGTGDLNVVIPKTDYNRMGLVRVGDNINLKDGKISVPVAGNSVRGLVSVGKNINVDKDGIISIKTASKKDIGVVRIGDGLIVDENGILSVDKDNTSVSMVIEGDDWKKLYETLKEQVEKSVKNNEQEKFNTYVILKNNNEHVKDDKLHIIKMTPVVVEIINENRLLNFILELKDKYEEIWEKEYEGSDYDTFDSWLTKELIESCYPFKYDEKENLEDLFLYYEIVKLLSIDNMDLIGFILIVFLLKGIYYKNKKGEETTIVDKKNLTEIKKITSRIPSTLIDVIEHGYKYERLNIFLDKEEIPEYFDVKEGKQLKPICYVLGKNNQYKLYKYSEKNIEPLPTTYKLYEDFSWKTLYSYLKKEIDSMGSANLYGTYVELRNTNENNLSHKRFTIQITKDVVDATSESETFFKEIVGHLSSYSDNELEILYPQSKFDKDYVLNEFPYYLLIRLLSKENMDFTCLYYINSLLSEMKGMEDIKTRTSRNITKKVEITECSQNIEERMELLFERPGENYSFDEYFYNGKQMIPIVFELKYNTDEKKYRYEIVQ